MTGPAKHYPQVRARDRIRAICGLCPALNAEECLDWRKACCCPVEGTLLALERKLSAPAVPATQTKLGGI
jgi:hypothetical protein